MTDMRATERLLTWITDWFPRQWGEKIPPSPAHPRGGMRICAVEWSPRTMRWKGLSR